MLVKDMSGNAFMTTRRRRLLWTNCKGLQEVQISLHCHHIRFTHINTYHRLINIPLLEWSLHSMVLALMR